MKKTNLYIFIYIFSSIIYLLFFSYWSAGVEISPSPPPLPQEELKNPPKLSLNEPIFFAIGKPNTKVQISFKYRLLDEYPLHFGLKEEIFWDIFSESAPFSNVQYSPELFYRLYFEESILRYIDLGFFRHLSNGKDGELSRSLNKSFLRALSEYEYDETLLKWGGEIHAQYSLDENNKDIAHYQGFYTLEFSISRILRESFFDSELKLQFRSAGAHGLHPLLGNKTLTYQIRPFSNYFSPSFFIQTSYGYSDSILFYKKTEFTIRLGISLFDEGNK